MVRTTLKILSRLYLVSNAKWHVDEFRLLSSRSLLLFGMGVGGGARTKQQQTGLWL